MWPGQAMTLKVKNVLHHEKSKYQDVLIFESTDYGTVLVLDNVIQCTERDEFAYQEMITHLAMFSHPDPKKVLVIGGGDGGVLREVIKHDCVEEAVLCDIDEVSHLSSRVKTQIITNYWNVQAVIRLSKKYLPGMSISYQHHKVKVHVGDGFKFLDDYKNEFDVIITDSSDPEGPAESLFQKPYFELLFGALKEGGVITTQGCTFSFVVRSTWCFLSESSFTQMQSHHTLFFLQICTSPPLHLFTRYCQKLSEDLEFLLGSCAFCLCAQFLHLLIPISFSTSSHPCCSHL
jgi:spermidine synthase